MNILKKEWKKEVEEILKKHNYKKSELLQVLLEIQDASSKNYISEEKALYVSEKMGVSLSKISGMISFFSVLSSKERGENIIRVCKSTACMINGHTNLLKVIKEELGIDIGETTDDGLFSLETTECIGACDISPAFKIDHKVYGNLTESKIIEILRSYKKISDKKSLSELTRYFHKYNPDSLTEYVSIGGFNSLKKAIEMDSYDVIDIIKESGLRGRGGAGYPTGKKLTQAKSVKGDRKVLICNADEGEPGTFKDRQFIEFDPFQLIEGIIITSLITDVTEAYIYIRHEYNHLHRRLKRAVAKCREMNYLGKNILGSKRSMDIKVFSGAGAYVCGQGGALIESMEGKVGYPRTKPPYTKQKGLHQLPTLVINVETLVSVSTILDIGVEEYLSHGTKKSPGTKMISISGNIKKPGAYEVPFGITIEDIIKHLGNGVNNNKKGKFVQIGGASGPLIPAYDFDIKLCYDELQNSGYAIGSGAFVVCDEDQKVSNYLKTVYEFFEHESCGKCTPCRETTHIIAKTFRKFCKNEATFDDLLKVKEAALYMKDSALCGLGQTAGAPLLSAFEHFEAELKEEENSYE